jgi:hypothetical protein
MGETSRLSPVSRPQFPNDRIENYGRAPGSEDT